MGMSIRGLASGLDIDGIIEKLMAVERQPIVQMASQQKLYQQRIDGWRDINSRLYNLRQAAQKLADIKDFQPLTSATSNKDVLTVTANSEADLASYDVNVMALATKHRIAGAKVDDSKAELGLSGTLTINGVEIEIEETDTLHDLKDKFTRKDANIQASIVDNRLIIESTVTGADNIIKIEEDANGIMENLGILDSEGEFETELSLAADARFSINGLEIESSSNEVKDIIEGMTLNLTGTGKATISVKEDQESVVKKFEEFVAQFNSSYQFILEKMGKEEILQGDSALNRVKDQIRSALMDTIGLGENENVDQAAVMGLSFDWKTGVLSLDKDKFTKVLQENPDEVQALWQGKKGEDGFTGITKRLDDTLENILKSKDGTVSLRQGYYQDLIEGLNKSMERVEMRAQSVGDRLISQWTALERALQEMSTQGAWLSQQTSMLGSIGSGNQ